MRHVFAGFWLLFLLSWLFWLAAGCRVDFEKAEARGHGEPAESGAGAATRPERDRTVGERDLSRRVASYPIWPFTG
jgi:hypothetical protein